jgi:putative Holliday junction resolvase
MKYLGIDYGSKRVGVALSDAGGMMAFPKKVIANKGVTALVGEIRELCAVDKVDEIVVGDSRDYHGRPNEIMKEIESFSVVLQEEIKLPVHFQLEFMTSIQAMRSSDGGKSGGLKGDASLIDASAAAIILQTFLDKKKA